MGEEEFQIRTTSQNAAISLKTIHFADQLYLQACRFFFSFGCFLKLLYKQPKPKEELHFMDRSLKLSSLMFPNICWDLLQGETGTCSCWSWLFIQPFSAKMYSTVYLYDFYQNVSELTLFSYDNVLFQEKKKKSSKHVPLQQ